MKLQEIVRLLLAGTIVGICSSQNDSEQDETPAQVLHYRKLFKLRRQERLEAVKSILKLDNMEKQAKLVNIVLGKIAEVLTASKVKLENSDYIPGGNFPHDDETRDALAPGPREHGVFRGDRAASAGHLSRCAGGEQGQRPDGPLGGRVRQLDGFLRRHDDRRSLAWLLKSWGWLTRTPVTTTRMLPNIAKVTQPVAAEEGSEAQKDRKRKFQRGPRLSRKEL
uniref:Putative secreted protein n=1 Tax=Ixodes ricinus TaxID=34613 RepID=A0A090XAU5_IXORI